jgi:hypothetical protein
MTGTPTTMAKRERHQRRDARFDGGPERPHRMQVTLDEWS